MRLEGWATTRLVPILRDARLRRAPQDEAILSIDFGDLMLVGRVSAPPSSYDDATSPEAGEEKNRALNRTPLPRCRVSKP